jgi:hypothetical protein
MEIRSLKLAIENSLREAARLHHEKIEAMALEAGTHETDSIRRENEIWEPFYADVLVKHLLPILTVMQGNGVSFSIDGKKVPVRLPVFTGGDGPAFYATNAIGSKYHVGE